MVDSKILCDIALSAGREILNIYSSFDYEVQLKSDHSPVTLADLTSNNSIEEQLKKEYSDIPIISEENLIYSWEQRQSWDKCFIVDPLDGTKEFIKKNGEFTVNIAYIENGLPVEGIIYAPVTDRLYYSYKGKAFKRVEGVESKLPLAKSSDEFIVVESRSHKNKQTTDYFKLLKKKYPNLKLTTIGSSLKFCLIAEGSAAIYPRLGKIMEWDVAAAHALIKACGGDIVDFHTKESLTYNKEDLYCPWFIASLLNADDVFGSE